MVLIPKNSLPPLYANEEKSADETMVKVKLFNPVGAATWYLTEYNPETRIAFGYCDLGMGCAELGYVSIEELESVTLPFGLSIERDIHWNPKPLSEVM
jgi:RPA family protein